MTPHNGVKTPPQVCSDGRTVRVNTICRAECNFGYQLEGTSAAACTAQGNWNPRTSPKCTGKHDCVMMSGADLRGLGVSVGSVLSP